MGTGAITAADYGALARSSPWLWRSVHLRYRGGLDEVEAWIDRPGRMRLRYPSGAEEERAEDQTAPSSARSYVTLGGDPDGPPPRFRSPHEVRPEQRDDGLVARRPDDIFVVYDDPIWRNYSWIALLDPSELSEGVLVEEPAVVERRGRETWTARLAPTADYEARCDCCALMWSRVAADRSGMNIAADATFPEAYDIALDRATGIVVSARPAVPGFEDRDSLSFEVEIVEHEAWPAAGG
ncbi:hypothetical protein RDV89_12965 [Nocardioides zeae]|uniref:Uncharacterized protein n=1 Tax=Nocardioides imazamoxiresistens TaxID=3231893 RepID=A0ABU3PXS0_9ACTN|nr:hypothetical protein [Nocardioides zeae]MDT9593986.1 hypothetical protein [Nocardioides zeae]